MKLPLPPYGDLMQSILRFSPTRSFFIFVGQNSFNDANLTIKSGEPALCLPLGKQPNDYFWPVSGARFIVIDNGGVTTDFLTDFICVLLQHEAKQVVLHTSNFLQIFSQKDLL